MLLRALYFPWAGLFTAMTVVVLGSAVMIATALRLPVPLRNAIMRLGCRCLLFGMRARPFPLGWHSDPKTWPKEVVWVANHESLADAPALVQQLGHSRTVRFVAKKQLFCIPFFGWALYSLGMVPVARGGRKSDVNRLNNFRRGRDLIFFAEGTRSPTGQLQNFKKGAVAYALHHGLPLMPVAVVGGYECLKPRSLRVRGGHVAVVVGEPISTDGLTLADRDRLLAQVHSAVRNLRAQGLAALDLRR